MEELHKRYDVSSQRTSKYFILVIRKKVENFVHNAVFLHTTVVAEKVHFVHLLLVLRFQLLLLSDKSGLQLIFLGSEAHL